MSVVMQASGGAHPFILAPVVLVFRFSKLRGFFVVQNVTKTAKINSSEWNPREIRTVWKAENCPSNV